MTQMVAGLITVGVLAKVVLGAVQVAVRVRGGAATDQQTVAEVDTTVTDSQRG